MEFYNKHKSLIITGAIVAVILLAWVNRSLILGKIDKAIKPKPKK